MAYWLGANEVTVSLADHCNSFRMSRYSAAHLKSILNSSVYLRYATGLSPFWFQAYHVSAEMDEIHNSAFRKLRFLIWIQA